MTTSRTPVMVCLLVAGLLGSAAQAVVQYTLTDLGTLGGAYTLGFGLNNSGQAVGYSSTGQYSLNQDAFRTAPNRSINPSMDDLGRLGGTLGVAYGINSSGQVTGFSELAQSGNHVPEHAFRTSPNRAIVPAIDDLGALGSDYS